MKKLTSFAVALAVPVFVALIISPAQAEDQPALDIHGFGGWALGHTSNINVFPDGAPPPIAAHDTQFDNYYFTLNLVARPTDKLVIHAQPTWSSSMQGQQMQLDLAYVELTAAKDFRVRVGKIRNPLGLYTAIFKVGTLRPFYLLPNGYYRDAPEGYEGVGLNYVKPLGSWELEFDLLGGQMDFQPNDSDLLVGADPNTGQPQYQSLTTQTRGRDVVGGGVMVRPPVKGLQLGASVYSMKLYASVAGEPMMLLSDDRENAYAGSAEYLTDKVSLRAEALFARGYETDNTAYVEAAYHLTSHWQVAGTYDYYKSPKPTPIVESLSQHRAWGAALNYWFSPKLVYKLNYYHVTGNRAARPADAVNLALAGTLPEKTDVIIAGMHFSF